MSKPGTSTAATAVKKRESGAVPADNKGLRELLHSEIENKTKRCANSTYQCSGTRLEGYQFCMMHILQDIHAPFTNCAYSFPLSGHRCPLAAPRHDRHKNKHFSNYCFEHSRLFQLNKTRSLTGKMKRPDSVDAHLGSLTHYVRLQKGGAEEEDVDVEIVEPLNKDPLTEIEAAKINERSRKILDYASDSETDDDEPTADNLWPTDDLNNSDCESIDSDLEDPLKHAGIYTTEEACRIAREKLIRLRALYLNQYHRLGYVLREKRRKYLISLRKEREAFCSIYNQPRESPEERHRYAQLKALNKYHRHNGVEAVLRRKYNERRLKVSGGPLANKPLFYNRCTFAEGGVKCPERSIPCCKFCRKHVMQDRKQVLFRACGIEKSGVVCQESVPMIFEDATCALHIEVPPEKRTYLIRKYESDQEDEEEDDLAASAEENTSGATIKQELLDDDGALMEEIKQEVD